MGKKRFAKSVAYHQHIAILRDLNDLFGEVPSSPSAVSRRNSLSPVSLTLSVESRMSFLALEPTKICQVQFKHLFRHCVLPDSLSHIQVGEFVIVESFIDKYQEDMGVVTQIFLEDDFYALRDLQGPSDDADENKIGRVLRIASLAERQYLPTKYQSECPLVGVCQAFVNNYQLPMTVYGVEYQYDGKVLFVYYVSDQRVDFRPLVKFLSVGYCRGPRIQMKKTNQCRQFIPVPSAREALVTGKHWPGRQLLY